MQTVGVLLAMSLLIDLAIAAYLLVKELYQMMIMGSIIGAISSIVAIILIYLQVLRSS